MAEKEGEGRGREALDNSPGFPSLGSAHDMLRSHESGELQRESECEEFAFTDSLLGTRQTLEEDMGKLPRRGRCQLY